MKLFATSVLCFALVTVTVASGQEKSSLPKLPPAPPATTPEGQLEDMKAEYEKAQADFFSEYKVAKSAEDRKKLVDEKAPKPEKFAERFMEFAKKHGKAEVSAVALGWIVEQAGHTPTGNQAIEKLGRDHVNSKAIGNLCERIAGQGSPEAERLLSRVLAENQDKYTQASACTSLGQYFLNQAELARELDGPDRATVEQRLGPGKVAALKVGPAHFDKKAESFFETIKQKYADVERYPIDRFPQIQGQSKNSETFGDLAKGELFELRSLCVGKVAPEIESEDLDGKKVKLSDLRGKVVVLDIWTTWCPPCRAMIPHERELVQRLKDKPFALVSVSFDDSKDELKEFIKKEKMPWTHWFNSAQGPLGKAWNIKYYPTVYVLDPKGVIRYKNVRGEAMNKAVETLLAESPTLAK